MRSRKTSPEKIKAVREGIPLTQQQLADELGVDRTAVAKWESRTAGKAPSPANFKALCRVLKVKAHALYAESEAA